MGFRFRQRIKLLSGVHINVSGNGITSLSIGGHGGTLNINKNAQITSTVGLPGTGLSYRQILHQRKGGNSSSSHSFIQQDLSISSDENHYDILPIQSNRLYLADWSSPELNDITDHILEFQNQRLEIDAEISKLSAEISRRRKNFLTRWYLKLFKPEEYQTAQTELKDIQAELDDTHALLHEQDAVFKWELPTSLQRCYDCLSEEISKLAKVNVKIWHIKGESIIDQVHFRAAYSRVLDRVPAKFVFDWPAFIPKNYSSTGTTVPCLKSENDFALYFFPTFVAVRESLPSDFYCHSI